MPIPKPHDGESQDAFVARCMSAIGSEYDDQDQALAICYAAWREAKKAVNEELLKAIRARQQKRAEFGYGIQTADVYVRNVLEAVGVGLCYKCAATRTTSFHDVLEKAARTLTYSNPDMEVQGVEYQKRGKATIKELDGIELPKNTLMVFRHVLTTPRKDRDGDIMRTEGAAVDPKLPLLWQHIHTVPIGKMLTIAEHNSKRLSLVSCIVDLNETAHDAAVMIDNSVGRWSHGFRALEFEKIKDKETGEEGFDIKQFEIMEASLVSVPSNVDAETEEILLDLVEGGKLKSPLLVEAGKAIRERKPARVTVPVDIKVTINGVEVKDENKRTDEPEGRSDDTGASKETEGAGGQGTRGKESEAGDEKMNDTKAQAVKLNQAGNTKAKALISAGKVVEPDSWNPPSADAENRYIEDNGIEEFAKWHLGRRPDADPETKGAWAYIFTSDFKNVDRRGLAAIRQRAGQQGADDVFEAAGKLMEAIEGEGEEEEKAAKTKAGRTLSKANETKIRNAKENVEEALQDSDLRRATKALLREASRDLGDVLKAVEAQGEASVGVEDAMAIVLSEAKAEQRDRLQKALAAMAEADRKRALVEQYKPLLGNVRHEGRGE